MKERVTTHRCSACGYETNRREDTGFLVAIGVVALLFGLLPGLLVLAYTANAYGRCPSCRKRSLEPIR